MLTDVVLYPHRTAMWQGEETRQIDLDLSDSLSTEMDPVDTVPRREILTLLYIFPPFMREIELRLSDRERVYDRVGKTVHLSRYSNPEPVYRSEIYTNYFFFSASICMVIWYDVENKVGNCTLTIPNDRSTFGDKKVEMEDLTMHFIEYFIYLLIIFVR